LFKFRYHIVLASFLLSAVLWISLNLNQTYEIEKTVPVKFNINKPYAVSGNIPLNLDVKFRGVGWNLIRLFTSFNLEFTYDINAKKKDQFIVVTKEFLDNNMGLSQNLQITGVYPETLYVSIDNYEEKYVKLHPNLQIDCMDGYQVVGRPILEPDSIKIGGAFEILKTLNYFNTRSIKFENVNAGITRKINVSDSLSNILWFSQNEIDLKIEIEPTAEKEFSNIEIKVTELPDDKEVLLIPQAVSIQLKGGVNQLAKIEAGRITARIDFRKVLSDSTGSLTPVFDIPPGCTVISVKPETIQYVIKKKY
jgi:YbbR domain-containing protein